MHGSDQDDSEQAKDQLKRATEGDSNDLMVPRPELEGP